MKKQSKELTEFYRDYLAWYDSGCPDGSYSRVDGLCMAIEVFSKTHGIAIDKYGHAIEEMQQQFWDAGLRRGFPFESIDEYFRSDDLTTNPKRIAWVREHATC